MLVIFALAVSVPCLNYRIYTTSCRSRTLQNYEITYLYIRQWCNHHVSMENLNAAYILKLMVKLSIFRMPSGFRRLTHISWSLSHLSLITFEPYKNLSNFLHIHTGPAHCLWSWGSSNTTWCCNPCLSV